MEHHGTSWNIRVTRGIMIIIVIRVIMIIMIIGVIRIIMVIIVIRVIMVIEVFMVILVIRVLRVNFYQSAFNYQKEKLNILAEMLKISKKWPADV